MLHSQVEKYVTLHPIYNFLIKMTIPTFDFQRKIARSQMVLPVVSVIAFVVWFLVPSSAETTSLLSSADTGLWQYLPEFMPDTRVQLAMGVAVAAICVYLLAELNNANVLLRISSRMLSSMLAILLMVAVQCHTFQPGLVIMLFLLLSFFSLFSTVQLQSPMLTFVSYLLVSVASLLFPKLLLLIPVYWGLSGSLRSFSFRCFIASLLAVVLPYWVFFAVAFATDHLGVFISHFATFADWHWGEYSQLSLFDTLTFLFVFILYVVGVIDFYRNNFLDKTRVRIIYNVVIVHAFTLILFIALQPQHFTLLLPSLLVDVAIVYGHFFALTYTRFSHILNLILLTMMIALLLSPFLTLLMDGHQVTLFFPIPS